MEDRKGILLETGTNEFEIVEFSMGGVVYGINVAKVREVINPLPVTAMPNAHPSVDGVFTLRGRVIPLVNLAKVLGYGDTAGSHRVLVSELNNVFVGFKVDEVSRIRRISWEQLEPAPKAAGADMVVGIVKMQDRITILLDFEKIVADVTPEMGMKYSEVRKVEGESLARRKTKTILIAEDSKMLRDLLTQTFHANGYINTICKADGKAAWDYLDIFVRSGAQVYDQVQLVVTDIEMPQMDGHHLTKRIKEQPELKDLPVIIFSSLINEENRRKGEQIGANAQVTKPEIDQLITIVDKFLFGA